MQNNEQLTELISYSQVAFLNGKLQEAFDMDAADITSKFPGKYDEGIAQAQNYLSKLKSEGKIKRI